MERNACRPIHASMPADTWTIEIPSILDAFMFSERAESLGRVLKATNRNLFSMDYLSSAFQDLVFLKGASMDANFLRSSIEAFESSRSSIAYPETILTLLGILRGCPPRRNMMDDFQKMGFRIENGKLCVNLDAFIRDFVDRSFVKQITEIFKTVSAIDETRIVAAMQYVGETS